MPCSLMFPCQAWQGFGGSSCGRGEALLPPVDPADAGDVRSPVWLRHKVAPRTKSPPASQSSQRTRGLQSNFPFWGESLPRQESPGRLNIGQCLERQGPTRPWDPRAPRLSDAAWGGGFGGQRRLWSNGPQGRPAHVGGQAGPPTQCAHTACASPAPLLLSLLRGVSYVGFSRCLWKQTLRAQRGH